MKFEELLGSTLPSKKVQPTYEGFDCDTSENCSKSEGCDKTESIDDDLDDEIERDLDSIDLDGIDDDDIDSTAEDDMTVTSPDDIDDEEEVELSDEEEVEADQNMALVATPLMLDDELTEESVIEEFMNEFPMIVSEGFLFESDLDRYLDAGTDDLMTEAKLFANKTKIQLNERDRKKQLFEIGVQASARAHNDPVYWKLQKCYKLERAYKAQLRQKYRGEALRRVKAYIKKLKSSTSNVLNNLGKKITGK